MCNPFHRATPWETSPLLSAPVSIRLIQGEIKTKLQHLLIGSYFSTYTNQSIIDTKPHKTEMFFLCLTKVGTSPCAREEKLGGKNDCLGSKTTCSSFSWGGIRSSERFGEIFTSLWECTVEGGVDHLLISFSCFFCSGVCVSDCVAV